MASPEQTNETLRLRAMIRGAVQGVGFRPFVYRLATEMALPGWVNNSPQGVTVEVEGPRERLDEFLSRIGTDKPPLAVIQGTEALYLDPIGFTRFEIRESDQTGEKHALILPDVATCADCLREVFDPADRRYLYPFTNCTNCGPRFTIIEALPYDRPNTTMRLFPMCPECRREYDDPLDRRFHAQPNACPVCGPHLELWDPDGRVLAARHDALLGAAQAIREGKVAAVKGLGGFHLMCDARSDGAVCALRERKHREEKPLALMYPSLDLVKAHCRVSPAEERILLSPECPIVLLETVPGSGAAAGASHPQTQNSKLSTQNSEAVAPGSPNLGVMLPYTPLHHILLRELGFPVVATSGNLSDEPICTDEQEVLRRLGGIAELFLVHNRPIARHVDDSIARVMVGRPGVMRRARGYAPFPIRLKEPLPTALAVGAHLKNTVALSVGRDVFISQHIGDLETAQALEAFRRVSLDLRRVYEAEPEVVVHDLHPEYLSTKFAQASGLPLVGVQHHAAHVYACMAENELDGPVLGVSWDGTGYGTDGTVWGGEFLRVERLGAGFERVAHLRTFRLPGGDKAVREPRRTAVGILYEMLGEGALSSLPPDLPPLRASSPEELSVWQAMLRKGANAPLTSSAGRLFDGVSALLDLCRISSFEGQAAMQLEFALAGVHTAEAYPVELREGGSAIVVDWAPAISGVLSDIASGVPASLISARFHNALVEAMVAVAHRVGVPAVALTGGVFQNRYLLERAVERLREEGFRPYWHQLVPPNDGGISLGQAVASSTRSSA